MIERYLFTALQNGLEVFRTRPSMFRSLFGQLYGLEDREVDAIRTRFGHKFPRLVHAFAPIAAVMPQYELVVGSESQAQSMLANTAGVVPPQMAGAPRPLFTNIWRHQYTLICSAQQRDMAGYMYEVAKCCLYLQVNWLIRQNINELQLSGQDIGVEAREPETMFYRALGISCMREFRFFADDGQPRLYAVDGLYVADGRADRMGGVNARLQVTTPPRR